MRLLLTNAVQVRETSAALALVETPCCIRLLLVIRGHKAESAAVSLGSGEEFTILVGNRTQEIISCLELSIAGRGQIHRLFLQK